MSKVTHWHIKTNHKLGTPEYPDPKAVHIYLTGCAKELESTEEGKDFELMQFESGKDKVDCPPCRVWVEWYFKQKEAK